MPKNLIVISVFLSQKYVELANLLLNSLYKYGALDNVADILIYCGPELIEGLRREISNSNSKIIFKTNNSIQTVLAATAARLDIFEFPEVANYEKILYLDTDILVIRPLAPVFGVAIDESLYALEEGNLELVVPYDYWGKNLFTPDEIAALKDKTGFSTGVLLFKNCATIRALFQRIKEHIAATPGQGFFEQAHVVYNAIKSGLKNSTGLKPFVAIDDVSVKTTKTILHFAGDVGNGGLKHTKMALFMRQFEEKRCIVTSFGSCRVTNVRNDTRLNGILTYTYTTREVLQLIAFIKGELILENPYNKICFRRAILEGVGLEWKPIYKELYGLTDVFVVEICSRKKYMYGGKCLHDLSVDKRFPGFNEGTPPEILAGHTLEEQTDEEIRRDLLEIRDMLLPRKMIVVSHYNARLDGVLLYSRDTLIRLLKGVCAENAIPFLDPTEALESFPQELVITPDLSNYTQVGMGEFTKRLNAML